MELSILKLLFSLKKKEKKKRKGYIIRTYHNPQKLLDAT
jgi:hypothetical protein